MNYWIIIHHVFIKRHVQTNKLKFGILRIFDFFIKTSHWFKCQLVTDTIKMTNKLLCIKPSEIIRPTKHGKSYFVQGEFDYFHYGCDGLNDVVSLKWKKQINWVWLILMYHIFDRDGVVPTAHCSQCAHGSQRTVTMQWIWTSMH